jgi:RNA polymerase sigma-70 factor, ECF subfamily
VDVGVVSGGGSVDRRGLGRREKRQDEYRLCGSRGLLLLHQGLPEVASRARVDAGGRAALQQELTALARGQRAAFDPLFRRLWPLLRGFAARCLPGPDADDAAQEALLRVFSRASEFDAERDALSWVLGIAAWQIRTHRARSRRRREETMPAAFERADGSASPEAAAMARDLAAGLDRALAQLPPSDAATLVAYARGERPDLPGPTFRKRVERALRRLRARWRIDHGSL